jgi:hypothetical protein
MTRFKAPLTYTGLQTNPAGLELGSAELRTITYEGFGIYHPKHDFMALAVVDGESELWSLDTAQRPDGSLYPSPLGLAALRRYYLDATGAVPKNIVVYERVRPRTDL